MARGAEPKRVKGQVALTGSRDAESLVGYRGKTPAPCPAGTKKQASFENPPDSRNSSRSRNEKRSLFFRHAAQERKGIL